MWVSLLRFRTLGVIPYNEKEHWTRSQKIGIQVLALLEGMGASGRTLHFPESKFPFLQSVGIKLGQRCPSHFTTNKTLYYLLHPKTLNSYFERFLSFDFFLLNYNKYFSVLKKITKPYNFHSELLIKREMKICHAGLKSL